MFLMKRPTSSNADEWQLYLQDGLQSEPPIGCAYLAVQIVEAIEEHQRTLARAVYKLAEDTARYGDVAMEDTPEGHYYRGRIDEAKSFAKAINAIMPLSRSSLKTLQSKSDRLEPCPFCGGEAQGRHERSGQRWHWCVVCVAPDHKCFVGPETQWFDTAVEAIAAWNRRSSSAAERAVVEALEKAAEQFEFYAKEHRRKERSALRRLHDSDGEDLEAQLDADERCEKAEANEKFAAMCRAAIEKATTP